MSREKVKYCGHSFVENTFIITVLQLFLIRLLSEDRNRPEWTDELIYEWDMNAKIEIYKYVFDEELLDTPEKIEWSKKFMDEALAQVSGMSLDDFDLYVAAESILWEENFERLKVALKKIRVMLDNKDPQSI